jgi:TrmH family RNA methyltransferase
MTSASERGGVRSITSLQNEQVKFIRSLQMRKVRREEGLFVAEGASVLIMAREAAWRPRTLVYAVTEKASPATLGLVRWAQDAGADCLEVAPTVMAKLASKDNPQNVMAVFEQRWVPLPNTGNETVSHTWLALEQVRDPGNLGTIVRTMDAVGGSGIILVGAGCDPYSLEAVRASMGSVFNVPLVRSETTDFLEWVRAWRGDVVGTHLKATHDFRAALYRGPALLVMGSEGAGLSEALSKACTRLVKIPMSGRLDSLNLAVATALALYQIRGDMLKV